MWEKYWTKVQKALLPVGIALSLFEAVRKSYGLLDFPYASYVLLGIAFVLVETYFVTIRWFSYQTVESQLVGGRPRKEPIYSRRVRAFALFAAVALPVITLAFAVCSMKGWAVAFPDPRVKISRIRIATQSCLWENISENGRIVGFRDDSSYLGRKWQWQCPPDPDRYSVEMYERAYQKYEDYYRGSRREDMLRLVYNYMKERIIEDKTLKLGPADSACEQIYQFISDSDYQAFRDQIIGALNGEVLLHCAPGMDSVFECMRAAWPQSEELIILKDRVPKTYDALAEFHMDFFRDEHPVFDIIIENRGPSSIIVHSASLDMRHLEIDWRVGALPGLIGGAPLEIDAEYDWSLSNTENSTEFDSWMADFAEKKSSYGVYEGTLPSSDLELIPPLRIPADTATRFHVRFVDGYPYGCEIRFSFYYGEHNSPIRSRWFRLEP